MNYLDMLAEHLAPLVAPLPAPSASFPSQDRMRDPTDERLRDFGLQGLQHPGPITMAVPAPWWRRVNWGFASLLAYLIGALAIAAWSLL
jgi:hypothetical protein